jgi:hypothetical protein
VVAGVVRRGALVVSALLAILVLLPAVLAAAAEPGGVIP